MKVPWSVSGRAVAMGRPDGLTKVVFEDGDPGGSSAWAWWGRTRATSWPRARSPIEMGAVAEDLAGTIHTHPTLSETLGEAAELFLGRPIHLPPPRG